MIRYLNIFWSGFLIYTISYAFSQSHLLNNKVCHALQLFGLLLIIYAAIHLIRFKFANKYLRIVFIIYCLWLLIVILRGFSLDRVFLQNMLFDAFGGLMPYFAPLILLFPLNISLYKKVFNVIILSGIFYIFYAAAFIKDFLHTSSLSPEIVEGSSLLSIPVCFLLLTFPYHSLKRKIFSIILILLTLLFAIIQARRALIFLCLSQIGFSYLLYLFNSKKKLLFILSTLFIFFIGTVYVPDIYSQRENSIFSFLNERGLEDTRTPVETYFFLDMKDKDLVIGRGINGQYFCPNIETISGYRNVIETGYLQIILKGGIIKLALILLITLPAIFKGLFFSKNTLSKAAGLWILLWVIYLFPGNTEAFSFYYLLVWISIGICYSKTIRNIPEDKMKLYFLSKEEIFQ